MRCCQNTNQPVFVFVSGRKREASASTSIPVNDLKAILSLAREQYLKMADTALPSVMDEEEEPAVEKNSGEEENIKKNRVLHYSKPP